MFELQHIEITSQFIFKVIFDFTFFYISTQYRPHNGGQIYLDASQQQSIHKLEMQSLPDCEWLLACINISDRSLRAKLVGPYKSGFAFHLVLKATFRPATNSLWTNRPNE